MAIKVFGSDARPPAAIDANQAVMQEGALVLLKRGDVVATFAPGFWSHWAKDEEAAPISSAQSHADNEREVREIVEG